MYPTKNNVFVIEVARDNTTASGIIVTGDTETGMKPAVVVSAGPDCVVKPGAKCYIKWGEAIPITHQGQKGAITSEDKILAYLD